MVDENLRSRSTKSKQRSSSEKEKSSNTSNKMPAPTNNNNNSNSEKTSAGGESATAKRRRSLFSVLFQKSSNKSSEDSESAEKAPTKARHEKIDLKSEISKSDIVLVRAAEAKCVEATIESMIPSDSDPDADLKPRASKKQAEAACGGGEQQQQKHSIRRLMKRSGARLKQKRRDEDADSYVMDLNDQLELEKLRISSSSSSDSSSIGDASDADISLCNPRAAAGVALSRRQPAARRQTSPADATWRTNQNYIPCDTSEKAAGFAPPPRPPPPPPAAIGVKGGLLQPNAASRRTIAPPARQKSPLLQEFLISHQIDPLAAGSSDEEEETRGSSCDSLPYLSRLPLESLNASLGSGRGGPVAAHCLQPTELMSESDRRLYHWRKLAERSVTMWQVPHDSSCSDDDSLNSDDDRLELMNCDSPALVCYCSDDTSCSSVELIWSRPQLQARQRQQNEMRRRNQLNLNSSRDSFVSQQFGERRRLSGSVSPSRQLRPTPSPASCLMPPHQMLLHANNLNNNINDKSYSSLVSCDSNLSGSNDNSRRQKPAVLELAKPSRARDRRIGGRRKSDAGQQQRRHRLEYEEPSRRDLSSRASDEWHPNPLFGPQARNFGSPLAKNSSMELASSSRASLWRGQSVDLLNCEQQQQKTEEQDGELSKSYRFKNFLARIKKLESIGAAGDKSSEIATDSKKEAEGEKPKSADDEDFDRFSASESFDANERVKRHRWSLRMRSPFASNTAQTNNAPYLGHHLVNLDKRIKSNVSSLKSHLHDTGKRASVLADQLITSIKDNTKEQLISAATGRSTRDRYDTLPNSFASAQASGQDSTTIDHTRAKQFALIFMHQQSQATGQLVITKQPTASGTGLRPRANATPPLAQTVTEPLNGHEDGEKDNNLTTGNNEILNIEEIMAECKRQSDAAVEQSEQKSVIASEVNPMQPTTAVKEAVDTCQTNAKIPEAVKPKRPPPPPASLKKRLRARKSRRQINVAPQSDDEDNGNSATTRDVAQVKTARRKYSLNDQFYRQAGCGHRCQHVTY